ncbi:hypothetical protein MIR68_006609 [Amoeboaphelidium protococcarum]|nr:hypothetical protein MIR68_006609 [Amoeboaphelidium protococcarum]
MLRYRLLGLYKIQSQLQFCSKHRFTTVVRNFSTESLAVKSAVSESMYSIPPKLSSVPPSMMTKAVSRFAASPLVGYWLLGTSVSVFGIVVVGGLTRLTESGLSMTEWSLVGSKPPSSQTEWNQYFTKYQQSPEYQVLNRGMSLDEFKKIFWFEYIHRMIGRAIGLYYIAGAAFFLTQSKKFGVSSALRNRILGIGSLIGFQGLLGWYMVKSGLDHDFVKEELDGYPRVSQYRLAAHLGSAFVIYSASLVTALSVLRSRNPVQLHKLVTSATDYKRMRVATGVTTGMVFLTALSGAFVAGLDAGLIYNTFPKMGTDWVPSDIVDKKRSVIRNLFENPTTVQFNHRLLAMSTLTVLLGTSVYGRRVLSTNLSRLRRGGTSIHTSVLQQFGRLRAGYGVMIGVGLAQVTLGITTLLWLVPIPLAAAHQAGSLTLLTVSLWLLNALKRVPK